MFLYNNKFLILIQNFSDFFFVKLFTFYRGIYPITGYRRAMAMVRVAAKTTMELTSDKWYRSSQTQRKILSESEGGKERQETAEAEGGELASKWVWLNLPKRTVSLDRSYCSAVRRTREPGSALSLGVSLASQQPIRRHFWHHLLWQLWKWQFLLRTKRAKNLELEVARQEDEQGKRWEVGKGMGELDGGLHKESLIFTLIGSQVHSWEIRFTI